MSKSTSTNDVKSGTGYKPTKEQMASLSERELSYYKMMSPKSGVLYLKSKPGIAKSAIAKAIAKKLGYEYIDLRLSMRDETDLGLYPKVVSVKGQYLLKYIPPEWAINANKQPTLINFDEINRASDAVRNAALQILLERCIGSDFCFNENVIMMACGNEGDSDGTNVEQFDSALNNRLIHYPHDMKIDEWIEQFAKDNVHPSIVTFLKSRPSHYYSFNSGTNDNGDAYPTPRSWTFLSDYIIKNYGKDAKINAFESDMYIISPSYVGPSASIAFTKFLEDSKNININEIIRRPNIDELLKDLDRSKKSELIKELEQIDVKKLKVKEVDNVIAFLKAVDADEMVSYLSFILEKIEDVEKDLNPKTVYYRIFTEFKKEFDLLDKELYNDSDSE